MGDYTINVFLKDDKLKKIQDAGMADKIVEIDGKKAVQAAMSQKDQKLVKGFPGLNFDSKNACVLPPDAEDKLLGIVTEMKTLDVMKFAIMKPIQSAGWQGTAIGAALNRFSQIRYSAQRGVNAGRPPRPEFRGHHTCFTGFGMQPALSGFRLRFVMVRNYFNHSQNA